MDNKKNDVYYFSKCLEDIDAIVTYLGEASYNEFLSDGKTIDSVLFRFIQLAENVKSISIEFKDEHPKIGWFDLIGFRNKIVHEYKKVDYTYVYDAIKEDLPGLKLLLEQYLEK